MSFWEWYLETYRALHEVARWHVQNRILTTELTIPTLEDVCSRECLHTGKGGSQQLLNQQIIYPFYFVGICRVVLTTLPCSSMITWLKICFTLGVTKLKFKCRNTNHEDINSQACLYYKDFCAWLSLIHQRINQVIVTTLYHENLTK